MALHSPPDPIVTSNLALAVITSSPTPLLLLDKDLGVIAASASFCSIFRIDQATADGCLLAKLGNGEWNAPQLASLLKATVSGYAQVENYELELLRDGQAPRSLVLNARKLAHAEQGDARLLLWISDLTSVRIAAKRNEDLLRDKDILLQELHHRVANSLQIVASVLMQSARKVQSDETRIHLYDAHQRVMSVAAVQKQLAASSTGDVELRPYFTSLCRSIGASMIRDHDRLSLEVRSDESKVSSDMSVSLGLIITELVINALKHAFPEDRHGKILVDYHADGGAWTLSVVDNGIGMPNSAEAPKAGLGTSIVRALAQQLQAHIKVADSNPGTSVCIFHSQPAAVDDSANVIPIARAV